MLFIAIIRFAWGRVMFIPWLDEHPQHEGGGPTIVVPQNQWFSVRSNSSKSSEVDVHYCKVNLLPASNDPCIHAGWCEYISVRADFKLVYSFNLKAENNTAAAVGALFSIPLLQSPPLAKLRLKTCGRLPTAVCTAGERLYWWVEWWNLFGGFHKWGYPKMDPLQWEFLAK